MSSDPAINGLVLRAKVVSSTVNGRTLVQAHVLDEDTRDLVELVHPYGFAASPLPGADTIELQVGGFASHKVQIGGDHTADAVHDLQPGEAGLSRGGQTIILRLSGAEIVTALLRWGPTRTALRRLVHEDFLALYNAHTHTDPQGGTTGPPTTPMTNAQLTG